MDGLTASRLGIWWAAVTQPAIWRRGLVIGLIVGGLQVAVNQGDIWLSGAADSTVVIKTIISPMIAISVAVVSAVWGEVATKRTANKRASDSKDKVHP